MTIRRKWEESGFKTIQVFQVPKIEFPKKIPFLFSHCPILTIFAKLLEHSQ